MAQEGVFRVGPHAKACSLDVVFIHGLGGNHYETWLHRAGDKTTFVWPECVADAHPDWAVWTVQYTAPLTRFAAAPEMTIQDRASHLALQLRNVGIGDRPSVFIMHSLGGLVVKTMCVQGLLGNPDNREVSDSIVGLVFCGTPHRGSAIATAAKALGHLRSGQVTELTLNSDALNRAHRDFLAWIHTRPQIAVQTYYETAGLSYRYRFLPFGRRILVVSQTSADTGIPQSPMYPIPADHHTLVKPPGPDAPIYAGVARFLEEVSGPRIGKLHSPQAEPNSEFRHNLPNRSTIIAREEELERIHQGLTQRSVVVLGMGGLGKSALAVEALYRLAERRVGPAGGAEFRAVIWTSAKDRDLRLPDLLSTIGRVLEDPRLATLPLEDQSDAAIDMLRRLPCVLVVDNADTITDPAVLPFVSRVAGDSRTLLTSREAIGPEDAQVLRLQRMSDDGGLLLLRSELERLGASSAIAEGTSAFDDLCRACAGAPLAIKWVAGQLSTRARSLEGVLSDLSHAEGDVFESIFARSWAGLDDDSRAVLTAMPWFAAGATLPALSAVAGRLIPLASQGISRLASLSLIEFTSQASVETRRYSLHPLAAAFAKGQLAGHSERLARQRLADWLANRATDAGRRSVPAELVVAELPNFLETARWCGRAQYWDSLLRISIGLRDVLPDLGLWNEAVELGQLGLLAAGALDDTYHIGRLSVIPMGWVARYRGQYLEAESWYGKAVKAFTAVGDDDRAAWARLAIGNILMRQGREPEGREIAEAVSLSGVGNSPERIKVVRAAALIHLSEMAVHRGDHADAYLLAEEARALSLETRYLNSTMSATYWMGVARLRSGFAGDAEPLIRESLRLNTEAHVQMGIALCNAALAETLLSLGRQTEAAECASVAKNLLLRLGMRKELADFLLQVEPRLA